MFVRASVSFIAEPHPVRLQWFSSLTGWLLVTCRSRGVTSLTSFPLPPLNCQGWICRVSKEGEGVIRKYLHFGKLCANWLWKFADKLKCDKCKHCFEGLLAGSAACLASTGRGKSIDGCTALSCKTRATGHRQTLYSCSSCYSLWNTYHGKLGYFILYSAIHT